MGLPNSIGGIKHVHGVKANRTANDLNAFYRFSDKLHLSDTFGPALFDHRFHVVR